MILDFLSERPTEKTTKYLLFFSFPLLIITASDSSFALAKFIQTSAVMGGIILMALVMVLSSRIGFWSAILWLSVLTRLLCLAPTLSQTRLKA